MSTLVIFDEDEEYVHNLMEYISDKNGIPFKVVAYSDFEKFEKHMNERGADLLLATSHSLECMGADIKAKKIIMLSEGEYVCEEDDFPYVYKYQSVDKILGELLEYYSEIDRRRGYPAIGGGRTTDIIGVYSPIGRCQKTSFAITLGQVMACERQVLYINLEEFSGLSQVLTRDFRNDLSDLMYHYRIAPDSIGIKLKATVCNIHGLDVVPPMNYSRDLRNVEAGLWKQMIEDIACAGIYDTVIVDLSNMVSDIFDILSICDTIYMPVKSDRISMSKINELEEYLLKTDREELLAKTIKIQPPSMKTSGWEEDYIDQLMWGEFGDFIRKLVKDNVA